MTDAQLAGLILPWAKEHHTEAYGKTVAVEAHPTKYRNYLLRLVELRCESERAFVCEVPISLLDETSIVRRARVGTRQVTVAGRKHVGDFDLRWIHLIHLMAADATGRETFWHAHEHLDLSAGDVGASSIEPTPSGTAKERTAHVPRDRSQGRLSI